MSVTTRTAAAMPRPPLVPPGLPARRRRPITPILIALLGAMAALTLTLLPHPAAAAALTRDAAGRLLGATGVLVSGQAYDVAFRDGSCATLFDGCDAPGDFLFTSDAAAHDAAEALRTQVFDAFADIDADPTLTRGCEASGYWQYGVLQATCWALTGYKTMPGGSGTLQVATVIAVNDTRDAQDAVPPVGNNFVVGQFQDLGGSSWPSNMTTWAVWSLAAPPAGVPEPGSAALAGLALAAASAVRRRRRTPGR